MPISAALSETLIRVGSDSIQGDKEMVKLKNVRDKCFADTHGGCKALNCECEGKDKCPFYKPEGCEDWIRIEQYGEVWLIPPEEYYEVRLLRKRF